MPPVTDILLLISLPVLLICSAFFSGSETALFSLSADEQRRLGADGSLAATLLAETRSLLITLLMGNMVVNVLFFIITTMLLIRLRDVHAANVYVVGAASVAPLVLIILFGEVLPKMLANRLRVQWSRTGSGPLFLVHRILGPVRLIVNAIVITPLARLIAPHNPPPEVEAEELEAMLQMSTEQGVIDAEEEDLMRQVFELGQLRVMDLMTHRVDMVTFDLDDEPTVLIERFKQTRLAQLPVYRSDVDHLVGLVRARDVLLRRPTTRDEVETLVRPVEYVPELMKADHLLVHLRDKARTMAIAVDEYGGTAGLVTLEDVVEHMVGHITGPFDPATDRPRVEALGDGRWRVDASLPVRDWPEAFEGVTRLAGAAPVVPPFISTLGGLVMARLGRLPVEHDAVTIGGVRIEVEKMEGRRVDRLIVSPKPRKRRVPGKKKKGKDVPGHSAKSGSSAKAEVSAEAAKSGGSEAPGGTGASGTSGGAGGTGGSGDSGGDA